MSIQALAPVQQIAITPLERDVIRLAEKTCQHCRRRPTATVVLSAQANTEAGDRWQHLTGICNHCLNAGDTAAPPQMTRRQKTNDGKPQWLNQLPLMRFAHPRSKVRPGEMIFGWQLSITNGRLQFDAIAATPMRSGSPRPLHEVQRLVGPRAVTTVARLKGTTINYTESKLAVPAWLTASLPKMASAFPKNPQIDSTLKMTDWAPVASSKKNVKLLPANTPRSAGVENARTEYEKLQMFMTSQRFMFEQALERDSQSLFQACMHIRGSLPALLCKYVDPVPAAAQGVSDQEYRALAKRWHQQVMALAFLPAPAEIALRIPWQLRDKPPTAAMRARVLRKDPMCRYCLTAPSTTADHVLPLALGGASTDGNLVGACEPCNAEKGDRLLETSGMVLHPPSKTYEKN